MKTMIAWEFSSLIHVLFADGALFMSVRIELDHWVILIEVFKEGSELPVLVNFCYQQLSLLVQLSQHVYLSHWEYTKVDANNIDYGQGEK